MPENVQIQADKRLPSEERLNGLEAENERLRAENNQLALKIRVLEMAQTRRIGLPEDERQMHLEIRPTETVRLEVETTDVPPNLPSSTTKRGKKKRIHGADKLANLPVEKRTVLIPEEVLRNRDEWKEIGREVTHEVLYHPGRLTVHKIERVKFASIEDRTLCPVIAKAPVRFSNDYISASLALEIVLSKYLEHGALHRLEQRFARMGLDLTRQTQSDVVERFSLWVRPLYELIKRCALQTPYLQIDDRARQRVDGVSPEGVRNAGALWAA